MVYPPDWYGLRNPTLQSVNRERNWRYGRLVSLRAQASLIRGPERNIVLNCIANEIARMDKELADFKEWWEDTH